MSSLLSGISGLSLDSTLILSRLSFFYPRMSDVFLAVWNLRTVTGFPFSVSSRVFRTGPVCIPFLSGHFSAVEKTLHVGIFA